MVISEFAKRGIVVDETHAVQVKQKVKRPPRSFFDVLISFVHNELDILLRRCLYAIQ